MKSNQVSWFYKFVNFYLYSSLHIGIAAVALTYQSALMWDLSIPLDYYLFVFAATILTYSIHRLIGIFKSREFAEIGRFAIINQYKHHIVIYAILSFTGVVYTFFRLPDLMKGLVTIAAILSALYTLPLFKGNRRLRDFNYIKIFVISIAWCLITYWTPYYANSPEFDWVHLLASCERLLFIFAITIPFDVRDTFFDDSGGIKTLPITLGSKPATNIAIGMVAVCIFISALYLTKGELNEGYVAGLVVFYLVTIAAIRYSLKINHDYYYSGLIDGLMILCPLFCIAGHAILKNF